MFHTIRRPWCAGALLLLSGLAGCSDTPAWEKTYPAQGIIKLKGKPVSDADLAFFPQDDSYPITVRPRAKSAKDGTFEVWTYAQGDGAPAGRYKVTVVRSQVAVSKDTIVAKPNDLPKKFSRVDSSDIIVTIAAGANEIPVIELR